MSELSNFSVHVVRSRGSVLLRQRCNTLRTSGFVDDVTFSYNGSYGRVTLSQQPRCNVVHGLTPLLRDIGSILS